MNKHTMSDLYQMQSLPLSAKIQMTRQRIRGWINEFGEDGVYVSFSGGKDSTVLLDLVRKDYPDIPAVFVDTGLEYPEIRDFVKSFDNVVWLKPKMNFREVIGKYGYPFISKDVSQAVYEAKQQAKLGGVNVRETKLWNRGFNPQSDYCKEYPTYCRAKFDYLFDSPYEFSNHCCNIMKKKPSKEYEKETGRKPIIGTMASESRIRTTTWLKDGCNSFDVARPTSKPISFWTEQDVLLYIKMNNLPICSVYGEIVEIDQIQGQMSVFDYEGVANKELFESNTPTLKTTGRERTGCMFCGYGCTTKNWNNLVEMKETHPKTYEWIMKPWEEGGLNYKEIIDWLNKHGNLNIRY